MLVRKNYFHAEIIIRLIITGSSLGWTTRGFLFFCCSAWGGLCRRVRSIGFSLPRGAPTTVTLVYWCISIIFINIYKFLKIVIRSTAIFGLKSDDECFNQLTSERRVCSFVASASAYKLSFTTGSASNVMAFLVSSAVERPNPFSRGMTGGTGRHAKKLRDDVSDPAHAKPGHRSEIVESNLLIN